MKAVVVQKDKTVKIEERPIPALTANEILLKTKTVGVNPAGTFILVEFAHSNVHDFVKRRLEGQSHRLVTPYRRYRSNLMRQ